MAMLRIVVVVLVWVMIMRDYIDYISYINATINVHSFPWECS